MSDSSRIRTLKYGVHASSTDWLTFPGTTTFLEPENEYVLDVKPNHVDRANVQRGNGQRVVRKTVGKMTDGLPDLTIALRGMAGGGAGNGTATSSLSHDIYGILMALFGEKTEGLGDTLSGTPGTGTTLTMDGSVGMSAGSGALIMGASSGKYVARQVHSPSGSTIAIDRDLTTDANVADDPEPSSVVYGGRTYSLSAVAPNRTHFAFDFEGDNYRNKFVGCLSSASLSFQPGGYATITLSGIRATDHSDDDEETVANPTWSTPTRGNLIQCIDSPMWIGSDAYISMGLEVDLGLTIAPRGANGPNGPHGFVVTSVNPTFRWSMVAGTLTAPLEVTDTILATLRADTAYDCAWQFGREVGGTCYVRAPALTITCERGSQDGMEVINCVGTPTDASEVSSNPLLHCMHIILF